MRKIISILLCLVMVLGTAANAFADTSKGSATTLRLEKTEGKVGMTKGDGKAVTIKDGIRLYDGYDLKTDKKSAAYISLDSAKAVMMDASTNVSIKKSGNKLDIMLKSGTILLNVEDKLKGNEELNIRTTNSVTGIRGTIIQASYNPLTQNTEIYLFEGETMGTYLAPDGTWYNQRLTTGSWLASGMGRLEENPQYNGWTVGPNGEWIYTNNKIEGTEFQQWRWSAERGWYTYDTRTSAITKLEAWPFTFKDLQPRVQEWILGDTDMLSRGRQHLDLYPELAENNITATRETAGIVLSQQQEDIEKQDAAILTAFEEGNGGNTVDNLFKETGSSAPSVPTYAMVYLMDDPATGGTTYTTQYYKEGDPVTAPADPTREGYTFAGWSSALPDAKAKEEETVYAIWSINQYTISFVDSDGTTKLTDPITQDYGTTITAPANPTKEGYTFVGWDKPVPTTMPAEDTTLTAQWRVNPYTITFLLKEGGDTYTSITDDYGKSVTAPTAPTKTGYTFTTWNPALPATMPAADTTVAAQWEAKTYKIIYNANGGTGASDPQTFTYDDELGSKQLLTLEEAGIERTGYDSYGWAGTAGATTVDFTNDDSTFTSREALAALADSDNNIQLYAVWSPITYTVHYNKNADDAVGAMDDTDFNYNESKALSANSFTRTGYTFAGWGTTNTDNTVNYTDGQTVMNLASTYDTVDLYAKWIANTYDVTLNTNGGTINAGDVKNYTYGLGATLPTAADITKDGYTFAGWYANADFTGDEVFGIEETETGDKTFYAKWIITVSFTLPTGATINSFTVDGSTVTPNGDGSYTVPSGTDFSFVLSGTYKVTDASGNIIVNNNGTYTTSTTTSMVLTVDAMPATARNVTVQLMYNPDKVSYTSYSNNVLAVAPSAAAASDTIFTLPEDEVLTFTLSEDESYGVTGAEGATRSAVNPNEYSVAAGGSTAILLVNKLSAVSSPNKPITLATGSAAPYKTASNGTLLFTPGSTVILDVSSYSASCQIIVDTVDPAYDTSTGRAPVLSNNQLNTAAGYDYSLIYATNGYSTIDTYGANVKNVEVISTSTLFYSYEFNSDLVYMVEPSSEFVFSVSGATVSDGPTTLTTETDGYYHITAGASGTNTSISIQ